MSEEQEKPIGIKRLEKRRGRLWGFIRKEAPGIVTPLSPIKMTHRLRHLMMSSIKTTSNYLKSKFGEISLKNLFEHQAEEFASNTKRSRFRADFLARDTILYNFQPLGIEATYSGNADEAKIFVKNCPLPQRFLGQPEFLEQITFDQKQLFTDFGGDTLTAKGEWPPKRVESCNVCRIVMPEIGKKLGFEWEWGMTTDTYRKCFFTVKVKQD